MNEAEVREQLRLYTIDELETLLNRNMLPEGIAMDRKVFLMLVIEVIKEKRASEVFNPVF